MLCVFRIYDRNGMNVDLNKIISEYESGSDAETPICKHWLVK